MQKLLTGKVRFKGFSEEWEEVRLGEIAKIHRKFLIEKNSSEKGWTLKTFLE